MVALMPRGVKCGKVQAHVVMGRYCVKSMLTFAGKDCRFLVHMQMKDAVTRNYYGAPSDIWVSYSVDESSTGPGV